jgi:hypothetical protein
MHIPKPPVRAEMVTTLALSTGYGLSEHLVLLTTNQKAGSSNLSGRAIPFCRFTPNR